MFETLLHGISSGVPVLLSHFFVTLCVFGGAILLYIFITPHKEITLIKQGNIAAALSLSGAFLGLAIPLAFCLAGSVNIIDILLWGTVILLIQLFTYWVIDRVIFRQYSKRIENDEISAAIFFLTIKLCVGILSAAAIAT